MTPFDLVFILVLLTPVLLLGRIAIAAVRGRRAVATRRVLFLVAGLAGYMIVVLLVGLVTPRREVPLGRPQCSDDWCIAVEGVLRTPVSDGVLYQVNFRLSSRARRVAQRERYVVAYLRDARGRRFDSDPAAAAVPFDVELQPQESVTATRLFTVPADAADVGLVVAREGGVPIPGCCIIADEGSLFHKKTAVKLQ